MEDNQKLQSLKKKADSIVAKIQKRINNRGAYENAGQNEIINFMDMVRKQKLHYQEECLLKDYINKGIDNLKY